ncbi:MAG TPA: NAD(+)/NADH kinase, partial [Chthoniobacterales bacterium]|nr:NAD(+)/NADH kinase [Chthoniobacterales bacterium]
MRPKTIGLIAHTGKPGVAELTRTVAKELERAGLTVVLEAETATLAGLPSGRAIPDLGREADLLVVLGGDGTILHLVG